MIYVKNNTPVDDKHDADGVILTKAEFDEFSKAYDYQQAEAEAASNSRQQAEDDCKDIMSQLTDREAYAADLKEEVEDYLSQIDALDDDIDKEEQFIAALQALREEARDD